jgi:hypothetical protein
MKMVLPLALLSYSGQLPSFSKPLEMGSFAEPLVDSFNYHT